MYEACISYSLLSRPTNAQHIFINILYIPEDDAYALKHLGVLTIYKILLINICCAFVGLDNKNQMLVDI